jgi:hypothetical protein
MNFLLIAHDFLIDLPLPLAVAQFLGAGIVITKLPDLHSAERKTNSATLTAQA